MTMTIREEVIANLRSKGKTDEEIAAHMVEVEAFFKMLADSPIVSEVSIDLRGGEPRTVATANVLDDDGVKS